MGRPRSDLADYLEWQGRTIPRVKTLEANDPKHTEYFKSRPEPGAPVHDLRLRSPEY